MSISLRQLILDSMTDDWEDIEQIYKSICLELVSCKESASGRKSFLFRMAEYPPRLSDIACDLEQMVCEGLVEFHREGSNGIFTDWTAAQPLLRCWFRPTSKGRSSLQSFAAQIESTPLRPVDIRDLDD